MTIQRNFEQHFMNIKIELIEIGERIRKNWDETQLESLKQDIVKNGLIQPICVVAMGKDKFKLVAGGRRLRAFKELGEQVIPCYVRQEKDDVDLLNCEISENLEREGLKFVDKILLAQRLEQDEKKEARKRKADPYNCAEGPKGETRAKVSKLAGFGSYGTYDRSKVIFKSGRKDLFKAIDKGEMSIYFAYKIVAGVLDKKGFEDDEKSVIDNESHVFSSEDASIPHNETEMGYEVNDSVMPGEDQMPFDNSHYTSTENNKTDDNAATESNVEPLQEESSFDVESEVKDARSESIPDKAQDELFSDCINDESCVLDVISEENPNNTFEELAENITTSAELFTYVSKWISDTEQFFEVLDVIIDNIGFSNAENSAVLLIEVVEPYFDQLKKYIKEQQNRLADIQAK